MSNHTIHVKTVSGKHLTLRHIAPTDTILKIKDHIFSQIWIPSDQQHLYVHGSRVELKDDENLADHFVDREVTLYLAFPIRGMQRSSL